MYTEDGFELRPVGDTMEIYASGEQFHEANPPVVAAFRTFSARMPITKVICDVRLAAYILDPTEQEVRARTTARALLPYKTAIVCLTGQRPLLERTAEKIREHGGTAELFSSKSEARDWLATQNAGAAEAPAVPTRQTAPGRA
ncbi:MAG: hypothetical protein U9P68_10890 [Pseudomonadota bacterium]|nr:hypothetical protein [Pseudomonadota bacterium]